MNKEEWDELERGERISLARMSTVSRVMELDTEFELSIVNRWLDALEAAEKKMREEAQ
jgi:hypothetical protein